MKGTTEAPQLRKHSSQKMKKKGSFAALSFSLFVSLEIYTPQHFKSPICLSTHMAYNTLFTPICLFQGRATTNFPQKSLHLKYSSLFCSSVWGIAKLQVQVQLPTFERDSLYAFCTAFSMTGVVWKFYGFSSEECALELIKCAFVSACCAAWM